MSDDEFGLSRRKLLGGLGTVGIASAGAGLGTSAFFNDTETFSGNSVQAGTLDLAVEAEVYEFQEDANGNGQSFGGIVNGGTPLQISLDDVKPGDYSYGRFCFSIVDNPGFIWASGELTSNDDNTPFPEPEDAVDGNPDDDSDGTSWGDLADAIQVTLFYVEQGNFDPSGQGGRPSDQSFSDVIASGSLREVLAALQAGIPLDGDGGAAGRQAFPGESSQSFDAGDRCLAFAWEVPTSVGNIIQTDSVTFDVEFTAIQERHNDGSANPYSSVTTLNAPSASFRGFGTTTSRAHSGSGSWQSAGPNKETLYLGPDFAGFNALPAFTVGDIERISYHSWKDTVTDGSNPYNFYVEIYTVPQGGTVDSSASTDDASWYNKRVNAEPYFADNLNAPGGQWNEWSTEDDGLNELWFFDANRPGQGYGWYDSHPSFADLTSGPVDWDDYDGGSSQTVDYSAQEVKTIAISTGSGWNTSFDGYLDDITVELTSGETLSLDLEQ